MTRRPTQAMLAFLKGEGYPAVGETLVRDGRERTVSRVTIKWVESWTRRADSGNPGRWFRTSIEQWRRWEAGASRKLQLVQEDA